MPGSKKQYRMTWNEKPPVSCPNLLYFHYSPPSRVSLNVLNCYRLFFFLMITTILLNNMFICLSREMQTWVTYTTFHTFPHFSFYIAF